MRGFKIFLITTLSCFFYFSAEAQTVFFNVEGATNPASLSSWTRTSSGAPGIQPTSFGANNQRFIIRSGTSMTLSTTWSISGTSSSFWINGTLTVNDGGGVDLSAATAFALRIPSTGNLPGGTPIGTVGGTYIHNSSTDVAAAGQLLHRIGTSTQQYVFSAGSNFVFSKSGTHSIPAPVADKAFQQVTISGSGTIINIASGSSIFLRQNTSQLISPQPPAGLHIDNGAVLDFLAGSSLLTNNSFDAFVTSGTGILKTAIAVEANFPPDITWNFPVEFYSAAIQPIRRGNYLDIICSGGVSADVTRRTISSAQTITVRRNFTTCPPHLMGYDIGEEASLNFTSTEDVVIPFLPYQNLSLTGTGVKTINQDLEVFGFFGIYEEETRLNLNGNDITFYGGTIMNGSIIGGSNSSINFEADFFGFDNSELRLSQDSPGQNELRNLYINKDVLSGFGVMILSPVYIHHRLSLFSGPLVMADDDIHLLSSSISNTAQVDPVTNNATIVYDGVGRIVAERHIPLGKRAYRDLSSSGIYTDGSFIFENWQEGGSSAPMFGTQITGAAGTPNSIHPTSGLDLSTTGNTSMHMQINGNWTGNDVLNTRTRRLNPFQGYRIFIRGDRTHNLAMLPTPVVMTTATTLRARGRLVYGDITYNSSGITSSRGNSTVLGVASLGYSMNAAQNGFSFVANPFPAIVDWEAIVSSSTNIQSTYWYWDPALGTQGAYATYTVGGTTNPVSSNANRFIQPGMAIFTRNANIANPNPQLRINEAHKNPDQTLTAVFQTTSPIFSLPAIIRKRVDNQWLVMDGITLRTGDQFNNQIDTREDVFKLNNPTENIAIVANGGRLLSVDSRKPIKEASRIPFRLWLTQSGQQYEWTFYQPKAMKEVTDLLPVLDDRFTGKQQLLWGDSTTYRFTVTQDTGSFNNRFSLLFKAAQPALVQPDIQLAATDLGDAHQLAFRASNQDGIAYFNIESSRDGRNYQFLHTLPATGASAYSWKTNVNPADGQRVYYRIQQMSSDATFGYSNIAQLDKEQGRVPFQIYPNPVVGRTVQIQLMDLPKGRYFLQAVQENGGRGDQYIIEHTGSSSVQVIDLRKQVQSGVMRLQLFDSNQKTLGTRSVIVIN